MAAEVFVSPFQRAAGLSPNGVLTLRTNSYSLYSVPLQSSYNLTVNNLPGHYNGHAGRTRRIYIGAYPPFRFL